MDIYISKNSNYNYFIDYFILCLKLLNIKYTITYSDTYSNLDIIEVILIISNNNKYIIDVRDRITQIKWSIIEHIDIYYKCQLPMNTKFDLIPKKMQRDYLKILKCNKIKKLHMFRPIKFSIPKPLIKEFDIIEYCKKFRTNNKNKIIVTYTNGHHNPGRIKLYKFLEERFPDNFTIISNKKNKFDYVKNSKSLAYIDYLNFISSGYFILNLSGHSGSNPFRCIDALLAGSCVISDYIYSDAFSDFPCYKIDCNVQNQYLNEDNVYKEIKYLIDNYKNIYDELITKQKEWFSNKFNYRNYIKYICKNYEF